MVRVSIVGGTGYVAGDLLRFLIGHPQCELGQVISRSRAGRFVHSAHPNLRGHTQLKFSPPQALEPAEVLFLGLPHGQAAKDIDRYAGLADYVLDSSADFRLSDDAMVRRFYGEDHLAPEWQEKFVYGLPEMNREAIRGARFVSGVGCNATAVNLALWPLVRAGLADPERPVIAEIKVGSSEGGGSFGESSHHPDRSGVVRSYAPVGHRHTAEVLQQTGLSDVHLSVTAVEMVRGALATCHVFATEPVSERDLWGAYRECWGDEPFVRLVHDRRGNFRHPEPKLLAGSNHADVGFAMDEKGTRIVALCAIDNLGKGAAGSLIQCMNLMLGFDESTGLGFPGLHPA